MLCEKKTHKQQENQQITGEAENLLTDKKLSCAQTPLKLQKNKGSASVKGIKADFKR